MLSFWGPWSTWTVGNFAQKRIEKVKLIQEKTTALWVILLLFSSDSFNGRIDMDQNDATCWRKCNNATLKRLIPGSEPPRSAIFCKAHLKTSPALSNPGSFLQISVPVFELSGWCLTAYSPRPVPRLHTLSDLASADESVSDSLPTEEPKNTSSNMRIVYEDCM